MKRTFVGLLAGGLLLVGAGSAHAAKVSVEIEGQTVVAPPTVVTTAGSVTKAGVGTCAGDSIAAAIDAATGGDWTGNNYAVTSIRGEAHPFGPGGSWAYYVNGRFSSAAACDSGAIKDGDTVLFFWSNAYASAGYDEPLLLDAPTTAVPGQPFTVTAREVTTTFDSMGNVTNTAQPPAAGATVAGGTAPVTTGADGTAAVTVGPGPYTLVVTKGNRAPARIAGCATTGADGFCGTTVGATPSTPTTPAAPDTKASFGRITTVTNGKTYKKGQGPRQLAGAVDPDPSGIKAVELRLTRRDGTRCATYDAKTERLVTMKRCGATRGRWFAVGNGQAWTYLLPTRLPRGRYVLDLRVTDGAGNVNDHLIRGRSRIVFTVA